MKRPAYLILYFYNQYPLRASARDHLYCFERYADADCVFINLAVRGLCPSLVQKKFDAVIFHSMLLSRRWVPKQFAELKKKIRAVNAINAIKCVLVQDEFFRPDDVSRFIDEFSADLLVTCLRNGDWRNVFARVDFDRVRVLPLLTGYLDDRVVNTVNTLAASKPHRRVDLGYRATQAPAWWGSLGYLKALLPVRLKPLTEARGLKTDFSTHLKDTFLGDSWYEFLLDCRGVIGVEGCSTVLDRDGSIEKRGKEYLRAHPSADFTEMEKNVFPGMDGSIDYRNLSPRHLEACATRTCQMLIEGDYHGVLKPDVHYIPIKRDLSNMDEALDKFQNESLRHGIAERAYQDIVASGKYSYQNFVKSVQEAIAALNSTPMPADNSCPVGLAWSRLIDRLSWGWVAIKWFGYLKPKRKLETRRDRLRDP